MLRNFYLFELKRNMGVSEERVQGPGGGFSNFFLEFFLA